MKKRFTDCDIWEDPWYRKLPCLYKEMWRFLCDKCDPAGVWKVDLDMIGFFLGEDVSEKQALELFNSDKTRVEVLPNGKWFIVYFIPFQYGHLSRECKPHIPVFDAIERHGIERLCKGYTKGTIGTLQEKEKEKDKEKEEEKEKKGKTRLSQEELEKAIQGPPKRTICPLWIDSKCQKKTTFCEVKAKFLDGQCVLI